MCDTNKNLEASFRLDNQLCFPIYATSRMIIQLYQPMLDQLGLTYPQYLVLMVLAEKDEVPVKYLTEKLLLNTNTLTPLLKRMEQNGHLDRIKCTHDERKVIIKLTDSGKKLVTQASKIPEQMKNELTDSPLTEEDLFQIKSSLTKIIAYLQNK